MKTSILILERDNAYASNLRGLLETELSCSVVHVTTELSAVRELTTHFFHLMIVGFHQDRIRESLRLIDLLLVERKIVNTPPIMIFSDDQDPAIIQRCIKSGVVDYVLYSKNLKMVLPRIQKTLHEQAGIGGTLVRIATVFLGPAAQIFMERQAQLHVKIQSLQELRSDHLPYLFRHIFVTLAPILREKITQFKRRIEQVFGIKVENSE